MDNILTKLNVHIASIQSIDTYHLDIGSTRQNVVILTSIGWNPFLAYRGIDTCGRFNVRLLLWNLRWCSL